ncbi:hypothetical protein AVEN_275779-1 [Araneus ventricosus]|uniref:Uncharacterized protein n=1 Tax=Araneus ventricosus TaxID=182803 RepID=A0A4Y2HEQ6_ARAVE|nr:hypothetical protein AVEN_275779-1 [Araneus ventricosus]
MIDVAKLKLLRGLQKDFRAKAIYLRRLMFLQSCFDVVFHLTIRILDFYGSNGMVPLILRAHLRYEQWRSEGKWRTGHYIIFSPLPIVTKLLCMKDILLPSLLSPSTSTDLASYRTPGLDPKVTARFEQNSIFQISILGNSCHKIHKPNWSVLPSTFLWMPPKCGAFCAQPLLTVKQGCHISLFDTNFRKFCLLSKLLVLDVLIRS